MNNTINGYPRDMKNEARLTQALHEYSIPEYMHESVVNYILYHVSTGHFLSAVLSNDLLGAVSRADEENSQQLANYARFLATYAPAACWGSQERLVEWLSR